MKTPRPFAMSLLLPLALMILTAAPADSSEVAQKAAIDKAAPDFTLVDISGQKHTLSDYKGKYVVLEWNNWDCPFVKKHYKGQNMQSLQKRYGEKKVVWLTVCSSAPGKQGYYDAKDHKERFDKVESEASAYLIDADGTVGRLYGAKTTPHMFVINPDRVLIYAGAIDDKKSTDPADIEGATNYVQACLESALAGETVKAKTSAPYGCSVKYK